MSNGNNHDLRPTWTWGEIFSFFSILLVQTLIARWMWIHKKRKKETLNVSEDLEKQTPVPTVDTVSQHTSGPPPTYSSIAISTLHPLAIESTVEKGQSDAQLPPYTQTLSPRHRRHTL